MKFEDVLILIGLAFAVIMGMLIGVDIGTKHTQRDAISHGHAIYNPTNGEFMWRESCKTPHTTTATLSEDERICYVTFKQWELTNIYRQATSPLEVTTNEHRRLTNWMRINKWQRLENGWSVYNSQFDPVLLDSNSFTMKESERSSWHLGHMRRKWKESQP